MTSSIVSVESSIFVEEGKSLNLMAVAVGTTARDLIYEWNFGDNSVSIQGETVMHRYYLAGHYPLTLIIRDEKGTVSIIEKTVVVETTQLVITALNSRVLDEVKGIVAFEATATALDTASDTSSRITSDQKVDDSVISRAVNYVWNFGDGGSPAAGQKAIHRFAKSGTYYVSVIASGPSGAAAAQVHQLTLDKIIHDAPIKDNKEVLQNYPITFNSPFTNQEVLKTHAIHWDFGDGTTVEDELAPEHVYRQVGSYTVSLEITDQGGNIKTSKIPVEVVPAVSKILSLSANLASKAGDPTVFSAIVDNPSNEALTYSWDFGDGSKKSYSKEIRGKQVRHTYDDEGTYAVKLEVSGKAGSQAVEVISITISSTPQIESIAYPSNITKNKAIAFSAAATSRKKDRLLYQWQIKKNTQTTLENIQKRTRPSGSKNALENASEKAIDNTDKRLNQADRESATDIEQKTGQVVSFTFLAGGSWSVMLTVVDGEKTAVETFDIFVAETELAVNLQAKDTGTVGRSTEFRGYISTHADEAAANLSLIKWDFGDGTKLESQTLSASHVYSDEGSYTATLSATDDRGVTAANFVAVNVVKPPLILVAGGKVISRHLDNGQSDSTHIFPLNSVNSFCFYSGETLKVADGALVATPEVASVAFNRKEALDAEGAGLEGLAAEEPAVEGLGIIATSQTNDQETISEVRADDSVQYQQIDTLSVLVPQHHDLVSDVLLQTSDIGYDPTCIDLRAYKKQLKTAAGWREIFSSGEDASHPNVIKIERGPLVIPADVTLENIVIVVNRGDISFAAARSTVSAAINDVTLIAQGGGVDLSNINATNLKVFSSKPIQTTGRSHFHGNSLLASQQPIAFNGATIGTDALLRIISQQEVRFNASEPTQAQILANADIALCKGTTLQGSVRTRGNVIFNNEATLNADLHPPVAKSVKTVTLTDPELTGAIQLNIRLPWNAVRNTDADRPIIRVLELPSERKGILQLADGSPLFAGKQLTSAELAEVSFTPVSEGEGTSRFVYTVGDSWSAPARQTLSIRFDRSITPLSPAAQLTAQPAILWPPDHQMVEVTIKGFQELEEKLESNATVTLDSIVCSEPIGAKRKDSDYDYEVIEKSRVFLRAVQPASEAGRLYKLIYRIVDSVGEVTYSVVEVPVTLSANIYKIEAKREPTIN